MKILQVLHDFPPGTVGGTESYVHALCGALSGRGHECVVLAGSAETASEPDLTTTQQDGLVLVRYRAGSWRPGYWAYAYDPVAEGLIRSLLQDKKPDLVHVHHWLRLTTNLVAICAEQKIPAVVTLHDQWVVCPRINRLKPGDVFCDSRYTPTLCVPCVHRDAWVEEGEIARELELRYRQTRQELALACRLIVPSFAQRDFLHQITGLSGDRFRVLPLGTPWPLPGRAPVRESRAPGSPLALAHWGGLWPFKGAHLLIEALQHLPAGAPVEAHIFGVAPDPNYDHRLRELAQGLPVIFHGPYRPSELAQHALDVAVFPAFAPETYSFTLDEAFQLGLPVIVSERGALPERVGPAGLVFRSGDAKHLAEQIQRLLEDPDLLDTLRAAHPGQGVVTMDEHVSRLEDLYREAAEAPEPGSTEGQPYRDLLIHRNAQVLDRDHKLSDREIQLIRANERFVEQEAQLRQVTQHLTHLARDLHKAFTLLGEAELRLQALEPQVAWMTAHPMWRAYLGIRHLLIPKGSRREAIYWAIRRGWRTLVREGLTAFLQRTRERLVDRGEPPPRTGQVVDPDRRYALWLARHRVGFGSLYRLRDAARAFPYQPRISIVTPVYNVAEAWLRRAVESVRDQAYENWELCLVNDASTAPHIRPILEEYAGLDGRIKVVHLLENEGIAGASNHGLRAATGEYVGFLDHDDELYPEALFEVVRLLNRDPGVDMFYSDEDKIELDGRRTSAFFKPDWSPDLLLCMNYLCHFAVYRRSVLEEVGGFRGGFDGSQDWDLILRVSERTQRIAHIPKILYGWRKIAGSAAGSVTAKPYAYTAGRAAIQDALARRGLEGRVEIVGPGRYQVRYAVRGRPKVSLVIPVKDRIDLTRRCVESVESKSTYRNFEIVIIDNGSVEEQSQRYLQTLASRHRVLRYDRPFNYSAINNLGASQASGDYLLFLNNDVEVVSRDWLEAMLGHAQRPEVGAVGARLLFPSGRMQHGGVFVVGTETAFALHAFKHLPGDSPCYFGFHEATRNWSAVTGACMMVRRSVFDEVGGFEEGLRVAFNDVDLCLRMRQRGYLIVYTPLATLIHHESATRKVLHPMEDVRLVHERWKEIIERGDPYYNPNLTRVREDFLLDV